MSREGNEESPDYELFPEMLGRVSRLGFYGITILIVVILDPFFNDLLPVLTVSRRFGIEDFLYGRIFWISILLIIFFGIRHLKRVYYKTIDDLRPFLGAKTDKFKRFFITKKLGFFFSIVFLLIYLYSMINELRYFYEHPEIVGQSSMQFASKGLP